MNNRNNVGNPSSKNLQEYGRPALKIDLHAKDENGVAQTIASTNPNKGEISKTEDLVENSQKHEQEKQNRVTFLHTQKDSNMTNLNSSNKSPTMSQMPGRLNRTSRSPNMSPILPAGQVKPKIISGPSDQSVGDNFCNTRSSFDDMIFNLVPLTKLVKEQKHHQLLEKIRKMRSIPSISSYSQDNSYARVIQASSRNATHNAFMKSRLSALRKSPARIVLPKLSTVNKSESTATISYSITDQIICAVRIDQVQVGLARFDPYHSECGHDCRRCMFLMQTLPHLAPKLIKVMKQPETSKPQRRK